MIRALHFLEGSGETVVPKDITLKGGMDLRMKEPEGGLWAPPSDHT